MKIAWLILTITALTDLTIAFGTSLSSAMVVNKEIGMPSGAALLISALGALVVASRTIQQALKATPLFTADLRGEGAPIVIPAATANRLATARMAITAIPDEPAKEAP